jgi:hypothetical protein
VHDRTFVSTMSLVVAILKRLHSAFPCKNRSRSSFPKQKLNLIKSLKVVYIFWLVTVIATLYVWPFQRSRLRAKTKMKWDSLILQSGLDFFPVVTINVPKKRPIQPWMYLWPQGLIVYEIDTLLNIVSNNYVPFRAKNKHWNYGFAENAFPRDMNPPDQIVFPEEWITKARPRSDRLGQIQQNRDFIGVMEHFNENYCRKLNIGMFLFMEDDFLPCDNSIQLMSRVVKWASLNNDKFSFIRLTYGLGAIIMQCRDLPLLTQYAKANVNTPGIDFRVDEFYNDEENWRTRCGKDASCPLRKPFTLNHAIFQHKGSNTSTIWTSDTRTFENGGCAKLRSVKEYYTGFDEHSSCLWDRCISPCPNEYMLPYW